MRRMSKNGVTRILFLDFDGPLVTFAEIRKKRRPASVDQSCVANLNRIFEESNARVVVTSSWRINNSVEKLEKQLLDWGFLGNVLGVTPYCDGRRCIEICQYLLKFSLLNEHERPEFVIVDDEDQDLWPLKHRLIKVDPMKGLTEHDADRAIAILSV